MPPKNAPKDERQVNVKLPTDRYRVLQAAVFVKGAGNLTALVLPVLEQFIDDLMKDEAITLAVRAREIQDAREQGVVTQLPTRKNSS